MEPTDREGVEVELLLREELGETLELLLPLMLLEDEDPMDDVLVESLREPEVVELDGV